MITDDKPYDLIEDLTDSLMDGEYHKTTIINAIAAAKEVEKLRRQNDMLVAALRTVGGIISEKYGESDPDDDTDKLNAVFEMVDKQGLSGWERKTMFPKGLYDKYVVIRTHDFTLEDECFVLVPKKDKWAKGSIMEYARAVSQDNPILAKELAEWLHSDL